MEKIDISKYYDSISQESEINYLSENKEFNQNSNEHSKRKNLNCFPECVIC